MQQDSVIWSILNNTFCSHKIRTQARQNMCKNEFNVTGKCCLTSCPLSNSNYATVRENRGKIFLYIKTIERAAFPAKLWEKIRLSDNYEKSLGQIDHHLMYWPSIQIHNCKKRLTKYVQYLIRMRKLTMRRSKKLVAMPRKVERREKRREAKALLAAKLTDNIEKGLLERLKKGTYGELYKFDEKTYDKALNGEDEESEYESEREEEVEMEDEEDYEIGKEPREYVAADDVDTSEDDEDDLEDFLAKKAGDSSDSEDDQVKKPVHKKGKKRPKIEIEYETEDHKSARSKLVASGSKS